MNEQWRKLAQTIADSAQALADGNDTVTPVTQRYAMVRLLVDNVNMLADTQWQDLAQAIANRAQALVDYGAKYDAVQRRETIRLLVDNVDMLADTQWQDLAQQALDEALRKPFPI